jgi:hypothetical protein
MNTFKLLIIAAFIAIFSKTVFAQEVRSQEYLDKAITAYQECLTNETNGVVESAIYNVIVMKSYYPAQDYSDLVYKINKIAAKGNTAKLRYKAQLASLYFEYPALFEGMEFEKSAENPEVNFKKISERIEANTFAGR